MPILYILCGISGSGKSTWAKHFIATHPGTKYVSRDEIRMSMLKEGDEYFAHEKKVFRAFASKIAHKLADGNDTIADATHLNGFSRQKLTRMIDYQFTDYQIKYVVFRVPVETCLKNNSQRTGRARVSDDVIYSMRRDFEAPTLKEDTRAVETIIVGKKEGDFSYLMEGYKKRN